MMKLYRAKNIVPLKYKGLTIRGVYTVPEYGYMELYMSGRSDPFISDPFIGLVTERYAWKGHHRGMHVSAIGAKRVVPVFYNGLGYVDIGEELYKKIIAHYQVNKADLRKDNAEANKWRLIVHAHRRRGTKGVKAHDRKIRRRRVR